MIFDELAKLFKLLMVICLTFLTVEILLRRWYWVQIPTQFPGLPVYVLLGMNLVMIRSYIIR